MNHLTTPLIAIGILIVFAIILRYIIIVFFESLLYAIEHPLKCLLFLIGLGIIIITYKLNKNR